MVLVSAVLGAVEIFDKKDGLFSHLNWRILSSFRTVRITNRKRGKRHEQS